MIEIFEIKIKAKVKCIYLNTIEQLKYNISYIS